MTLVDISLPTLRQGLNAVNAHQGVRQMATYVACGSIPAAGTTVTIALAEQNASSQSGVATLIADGDATVVALSVTPGAAGVPQPVHIHAGSCDNLGGVNIPMSNVLDGRSVTRVDASLDSLLDGTLSINLHRSGPEAGFYTSCDHIPAVMVKPAPTGLDQPVVLAMNELNGSGQSGTVTFTPKGTKTEVTVVISPEAEKTSQPVHIYAGSCDDLGGINYPLPRLWAGQITTLVPVSLPALLAGTMAVNVHKATFDTSTYVSCGDIPMLSEVMPLAVVQATDHAVLGTILADSTGRILYQFTGDEKDVSNCAGRCAEAWPPVVWVDDPAAGKGIAASLLSTTTRDDGSKQATYNGKPLYYFANDEMPGDANGQDRGGVWFVVTAVDGPVQTAASVQAAEHENLGTILWDASGRALYLWTRDLKNTANCTIFAGRCAQFWPPLLTVDAPVAGDGVTADLLGSITRAEGARQVTYNGKPLYYFANDEKPGDTNGQDRSGEWFVVTADGGPVQTAAVVQAAETAVLGTILSDASGRALYVFMRDETDVSSCSGGCARAWPPLITVDAPVAGDGATTDLLGSITRADGAKQVTYNGKPLYYFANDEKPGDTNGQGRGDVWFVASPEGAAMQPS